MSQRKWMIQKNAACSYISYHETEENNFHVDKIGLACLQIWCIYHAIQIRIHLPKRKKKQGNLTIDTLNRQYGLCHGQAGLFP
jgi:hypothetical protein